MNTSHAIVIDWKHPDLDPLPDMAKRMRVPGFGFEHVRTDGAFAVYAYGRKGTPLLGQSVLGRIQKRARNLAHAMQEIAMWPREKWVTPTMSVYHGLDAEQLILGEVRLGQKTDTETES